MMKRALALSPDSAARAVQAAVAKLDRDLELTGLFHELEQLMHRVRDSLPVLEQIGAVNVTLNDKVFMLSTSKRCYTNKGT